MIKVERFRTADCVVGGLPYLSKATESAPSCSVYTIRNGIALVSTRLQSPTYGHKVSAAAQRF